MLTAGGHLLPRLPLLAWGCQKAPGHARGVWDCLELSQEQRQAERDKNPSTYSLPPPPPKLVSCGHSHHQMVFTWKWANGLFEQDPRASQKPPGRRSRPCLDLLGDLGSTHPM